ncbi:hypothetical protein DSM43518_00245 [Mycobacterium marinum]|nr:hypothetical protein CCUG20998_02463 [Mycobacterium marinum]RFZ15693.1 hypothetical protein DSM43518_00245 [Mycobacterium marinum]RFZ25840.1 hypothetical protein DSM44344_02271 [Mycobacterium marinum]RFZ29263.1 hypothetical protein DSM43519_00108 [Mycobacterium marinum]RFZ32638.1 hypothetical protein NCTC2275_03093 [Mycobacterium marinum]
MALTHTHFQAYRPHRSLGLTVAKTPVAGAAPRAGGVERLNLDEPVIAPDRAFSGTCGGRAANTTDPID